MRRSELLPAIAAVLACMLPAGPLAATGHNEAAPLKGSLFTDAPPAPDFSLTDQQGRPFRLSQARGKPVLLTFIYTHCADTCPFISIKISKARTLLGREAKNSVLVAVTTDPLRDTRQVAAEYSREVGLFDSWHFLTGSPEAVAEVWKLYHIEVENGAAVQPAEPGANQEAASQLSAPDDEHGQGLSPGELQLADQIARQFGGGYEVGHVALFWFIDRRGNLRATLDTDAAPADIAYNLTALMRER